MTPFDPPAVGAYDAPTVCLEINDLWASYVIGAVAYLDRDTAWNGDDEAVYQARQQIEQIYLALAVGNCMGVPVANISAYAGSTAPAGYLLCDGATYQREDYPDLYAALDAEFKPDADHFVTPDLRGITVIGAGLYNPGAVTYAVNDLVGARRHTLETTEIPAHTHTQNAHTHVQDAHNHTQLSHGHTQPSHNHTTQLHDHGILPHTHTLTDPQHSHGFNHLHAIEARANSAAGSNAELMRSNGTGTDSNLNTGTPSIGSSTASVSTGITLSDSGDLDTSLTSVTVNQTIATNNLTTATNLAATAVNQNATATNQNTGGGQPHNNMQPSRALNYIIRAE